MDKVLVTGGLGIIGSYVCRALLASSRAPVIYDIGASTDLIHDIENDCVIERGDMCDLPKLMGVIGHHKPMAIAHLAGLMGPQVSEYPWSTINTNFMGTVTVFEAARLAGIQRIAFTSSRQVYGPIAEVHRHPTYQPVTEEHPREPLKLYGKIKRSCEDIADHYAQLYGLDIVALRSGSSFGPGKFGRPDTKMSHVLGVIEAAIANRSYEIDRGAAQCDDLCYLGDTANGFIAVLDSPARPGKFRAYNISAGELISLQTMINILKDLHPSWNAAAGPGLDYDDTGVEYYFRLSTAKAQRELGYQSRFDFRSAAIDYAATLARLRN